MIAIRMRSALIFLPGRTVLSPFGGEKIKGSRDFYSLLPRCLSGGGLLRAKKSGWGFPSPQKQASGTALYYFGRIRPIRDTAFYASALNSALNRLISLKS